jgi:hypothetical protein
MLALSVFLARSERNQIPHCMRTAVVDEIDSLKSSALYCCEPFLPLVGFLCKDGLLAAK